MGIPKGLAAIAATVLLSACQTQGGGQTISESQAAGAWAESFVGPSGKPIQRAKCSRSSTGCYEEAHQTCRGPYQIIESESHSGGILADALPGPVTWYSFTYSCGPSDGRLASFPFREPPHPQPSANSPPVFVNPFPAPTIQTPRPMMNCSSNRVGNTIWTNCF
jgi:hypothetical protein